MSKYTGASVFELAQANTDGRQLIKERIFKRKLATTESEINLGRLKSDHSIDQLKAMVPVPIRTRANKIMECSGWAQLKKNFPVVKAEDQASFREYLGGVGRTTLSKFSNAMKKRLLLQILRQDELYGMFFKNVELQGRVEFYAEGHKICFVHILLLFQFKHMTVFL